MAYGAYTGERWIESRRAALSRDNNRCQDCGSTDGLHVHHVSPVDSFDTRRDSHFVDNLVTLCKYCHPTWEGDSTRPRLADARTGLHVSDVADHLVSRQIERLVKHHAQSEVFDEVWHDHDICNTCFQYFAERDCSQCGAAFGRARSRTNGKRDALGFTANLVERLRERGYHVDDRAMYAFVREAKSRPNLTGYDTEIFRRATAFGRQKAE